MPIRRGLAAPQNTFIDTIIKKFDGPGRNFVLGNATVKDCPIVFCSDGFCKLYGFTRAELMQKPSNCKFLQGEQTNQIIIDTIDKFLSEPYEQRIDAVFYDKDGTPISVSVLVAPIVNEKEKIVMYLINHEELSQDNTSNKKYRKFSKIKRFSRRYHSDSKTSDMTELDWKPSISEPSSPLSEQQPFDDEIKNISDDEGNITITVPRLTIENKSLSGSSTGLQDDDQRSTSYDSLHITSIAEKPDTNVAKVSQDDINVRRRSEFEIANDSGSMDNIAYRQDGKVSHNSFFSKQFNRLQKSIANVRQGKNAEIVSALDEVTKKSNTDSSNLNKKRLSRVAVTRRSLPKYKLEELQIPRCTILHYSLFKACWDWLILLVVLYTAVVTPFAAAFLLTRDAQRAMLDRDPETRVDHSISDPYSDPLFVIDWIVDVTFIVDILINFRTTYVNSNDEIVTDWKKIALHYVKSWFIIDMIAAIPFELFIGGEQNEQTITLIGLLKTARLLRVIRVVRKVDRYSETGAAILVLLMFAFALIAHWLACIWYAIGVAERPDLHPKYTWLDTLAEEIHQPFNKSIGDGGPTMVDRYLTALYFTFSSLTTVGFGNVSATTQAEKVFAILVMWLGSLMYASIFGNVTAIIQRLYASTARYHAHMKKIREFIKFHKIPYPLKNRLIEYFQHTWSYHKGIDMTSVLKSFPESLQADISLHLNRNLLENSPVFATSSPSCLRSLGFKIQSTHCPPGDYLIMQGDKLNALYFISRGSVEVLRNDVVVAILGVGDTFGENFYVFRDQIKSNANVRALTYCDLHTISRDSLLEVLNAYPEFAENFSDKLEITYNLREKQPSIDTDAANSNSDDLQPRPRTRTRSCAVTLSARSLEHLYGKTTTEKGRIRGRSASSSHAVKFSRSHLSPMSATNSSSTYYDTISIEQGLPGNPLIAGTAAAVNSGINSSSTSRNRSGSEGISTLSRLNRQSHKRFDGNDKNNPTVNSFTKADLQEHIAFLASRIDRLEEQLSKDVKTVMLLLQEQPRQQPAVTNLFSEDPHTDRNSSV